MCCNRLVLDPCYRHATTHTTHTAQQEHSTSFPELTVDSCDHGRKSRGTGDMSPTFLVEDGLAFCPLHFLYKITAIYFIYHAVFGQPMPYKH